MSTIKYFIKLKLPDSLKKTSLSLSPELIFPMKYISLTLDSWIKLSIRTLKISLRSQD
jgi:hypothetical protein